MTDDDLEGENIAPTIGATESDANSGRSCSPEGRESSAEYDEGNEPTTTSVLNSVQDFDTAPNATTTSTKEVPSMNAKCVKCNKRLAREGCTQSACLPCCDDVAGCESHAKPRAHALWKEQVLAGTTEVQQLAAAKLKMRIPAGRFFREPGFVYQGDTVVIWDLRAYARNPKWREDAVRKSVRRSKAAVHSHVPRLKNSRKRFHRLMHELYLASQESQL